MLERLKALSDDHFETHPDEINHVGTLKHYAACCARSIDSASSRKANTPPDAPKRRDGRPVRMAGLAFRRRRAQRAPQRPEALMTTPTDTLP